MREMTAAELPWLREVTCPGGLRRIDWAPTPDQRQQDLVNELLDEEEFDIRMACARIGAAFLHMGPDVCHLSEWSVAEQATGPMRRAYETWANGSVNITRDPFTIYQAQ